MKTIQVNVYNFDELSSEAKKKSLNKFYDLNVSNNWWQYTYADAFDVGIKITSFDIDRASYCNIEIKDVWETIKLILHNHGEMCDTFKTTLKYEGLLGAINSEEKPDEWTAIAEDYKNEIAEDYLSILKHEYEYLTSESAIIESIESNGYQFLSNGDKFIEV